MASQPPESSNPSPATPASGMPMTHPLILIAAGAVILFCLVGILSMTGVFSKGAPATAEKVAGTPPPTAVIPATTASAETTANAAPTVPAPAAAPAVAPTTPPPVAASKPAAAPKTVVASAPPPPPRCANCGTVQSVKSVTVEGQGSGAGAAVGGALGGVLGHQVGGGRGQDVATVLGAVGGALAGNAIEKQKKTTVHWEVRIQMQDGTHRTLKYDHQPDLRNGDKVRIEDGRAILD